MSNFSKKTFQKLNNHFIKLKQANEFYEENYKYLKEKKLQHSRIVFKNKNLVKNLLMELIFFKIQLKNLFKEEATFNQKILLKNKNFFVKSKLTDDTYLSCDDKYSLDKEKENLIKIIFQDIKRVKSLIKKCLYNLKYNINILSKDNGKSNLLKKFFFVINNKVRNYLGFITEHLIKGWYIYIARFLVISLLHFIPFIQLSTTLFYNQPNKQIAHPITSYLFNIAPFLLPIINLTMPILNQDTISFLLLVPYLYFFIYSFKKYNISRKIAYQGSFALALMLFRYSLILSQEAVSVIYKFTKRFFFLRKFRKLDLLREDLSFYLDDLEELRNYREELLQLGESIFSLNDLTKITKLWESTTIFSFLGVIALLYNYMYFIFRGQKPIIPVVTRTVQRMMIDRNGKES